MDLTRPFTRADAVAAGVDPRILRTSRFRRLFRSVYVESHSRDEFIRMRAALALHPPTAFISHHSAAVLYRLPVPLHPDVHVTVLAAADRRQRLGLKLHVVTGVPMVVEHKGMLVSHPYRMFIEMAGVLDLVNLVVLGDAMLKVFDITPDDLVRACAESDRHHAFAAHRGALMVRAGVDSPMESRLRMLLVLAGLPEPVVDHRLLDRGGRTRRRFDLSYPSIKLAVEYDGRQHAESTAQWEHDVRRREELDNEGWRLIVVQANDLFRSPEETIERVRTQLLVRGWGDVPPVRDVWRLYFLAA